MAGQISAGRMSTKGLGHLVTHVEKPAIGAVSHKSKINFSWIKILNLESKYCKNVKENMRECLSDLGSSKTF